MATRSLANVEAESTGRARYAREHASTSSPFHGVGASDFESGTVTPFEIVEAKIKASSTERGGLAVNGGHHRINIVNHVHVICIIWFRIGGRCYHLCLVQVIGGGGRVEAFKPRLRGGVVTSESNIHVKQTHVPFGVRKVVRGGVINDEAAGIDRLSIDWLSKTILNLRKAEKKTGYDGRGEHFGEVELGSV
ncbi:MAG: hypothetical protein Q9203_003290 [Teloschistes exilis]